MSTQKALRLQGPLGEWKVDEVPIPVPGPGEILVKVLATALNPIDWKIQKQPQWKIISDYPAVLGSDSAGTVEQLGEGVDSFAKGDRVVHQGYFTNTTATFQQYTIVPAEIVAKLPDSISFDAAASIPLGLATAAVAIYDLAKYTPAWEITGHNKYTGTPLLLFGGSTSVGQFVIQLAKLSGFNPIIATASPHNKQLLFDLGATHFIDRKADVAAEVKKITSSPIELVYDAISLESTQQTAWDLTAPNGHLVLVLPPLISQEKYPDKKFVNVFGNVHPESNRALGKSLYAKLTSLLAEGIIKPNRVEVLPDGLVGIIDGLERMSRDEVSGTKLVAHPHETA